MNKLLYYAVFRVAKIFLYLNFIIVRGYSIYFWGSYRKINTRNLKKATYDTASIAGDYFKKYMDGGLVYNVRDKNLSFLLLKAVHDYKKKSLKINDIGGGYGIHESVFKDLCSIESYTIYETPSIKNHYYENCVESREYQKKIRLFEDGIEDCDLLLLSGSIQYVPDGLPILRECLNKCELAVFTRFSLLEDQTVTAFQIVRPPVYEKKAIFPVTYYKRSAFEELTAELGFETIYVEKDQLSQITLNFKKVQTWDYVIRRKV